MPLLADASRETLRFVAAALSECLNPPAALIRTLCDQPVDICAALLVRSSALRDIDLLALIGRHGLGHALAIERRANLNPRIAKLIAALKSSASGEGSGASTPVSLVPAARDRLRAMMVPESARSPARWQEAPSAYLKLRAAALTGNATVVRATLVSLLSIDEHHAVGLLSGHDQIELKRGLKSLGLSAEEAYLVVSAMQPHRFGTAAAIRQFIGDYAGAQPWQSDGLDEPQHGTRGT